MVTTSSGLKASTATKTRSDANAGIRQPALGLPDSIILLLLPVGRSVLPAPALNRGSAVFAPFIAQASLRMMRNMNGP
jgi:hypothetical protein